MRKIIFLLLLVCLFGCKVPFVAISVNSDSQSKASSGESRLPEYFDYTPNGDLIFFDSTGINIDTVFYQYVPPKNK